MASTTDLDAGPPARYDEKNAYARGCIRMDVSQPSQENLQYMIEGIVSKLKMATMSAMNPASFHLDDYEDVKDIYELVMSKDRFSITEMEAIVSELGKLRRSS